MKRHAYRRCKACLTFDPTSKTYVKNRPPDSRVDAPDNSRITSGEPAEPSALVDSEAVEWNSASMTVLELLPINSPAPQSGRSIAKRENVSLCQPRNRRKMVRL